jgi:hypothetical protein
MSLISGTFMAQSALTRMGGGFWQGAEKSV